MQNATGHPSSTQCEGHGDGLKDSGKMQQPEEHCQKLPPANVTGTQDDPLRAVEVLTLFTLLCVHRVKYKAGMNF